MRDLYIQIARDTQKSKELQQLAIDEEYKDKSDEIRKLQDDIYKRTDFKKKFLKARSGLNGRTQ